MERIALPLLLASERFASADETRANGSAQDAKGVFLLTQNGSDQWKDLFKFRPYDWGPYSSDLASDLRSLTASGLLSDDHSHLNRYGAYRTTSQGENEINNIDLNDQQADFIKAVRAFVSSRPSASC